jgi:hypothetical protein
VRITLHIESLVLDGVPLARGQQPRLQAAVIEALTQRLGESTLASQLAASGGRDVVQAAPIRVGQRPDARALGTQIAASISAGLEGDR